MTATKKKRLPILLIISLAVLAAAIILTLISRLCGGFGEWYATNIYPVWVCTAGFICGLFPFAVGEVLLYLLILAAVGGTVSAVVLFIKSRGRRKKVAARYFTVVLCVLSSLFLSYTMLCGINYTRTPFSVKRGMEYGKYSAEELTELCEYLIGEINSLVPKVYKQDGILDLSAAEGFDLENETRLAMEKLSRTFPELGGFYPNAKGVMFSEFMCRFNIVGIYDPFTVEANYNTMQPDFTKPLTLCHELSHLKGFMREDEANFIAYLACRDSDSDIIRYCGDLNALIFVLNALYGAVDSKTYARIYYTLDKAAVDELGYNRDFWERYKTPAAQISQAVNDGYIKVNGDSDGVRSYGRCVDLMLYEYFETHR